MSRLVDMGVKGFNPDKIRRAGEGFQNEVEYALKPQFEWRGQGMLPDNRG
jgi:hypothetical protein